MSQPLELKEYEYTVGHMKVTAMLTEKKAAMLGAVPVGEAVDPPVGQVPNREAEGRATHTREAEDNGVSNPAAAEVTEKTRAARNKRSQ